MKRIVKESYEVSPELEQRLNSILADEFLAAEFYRLAELAMKGKKQHLLSEIAEENGEDELEDHFKNLSEWMQSKGLRVVTNHDEMLDITGATVFTVEDGDSTEEIVDKLIQSEEEAIEAYENLIPETDLDLHTMLCGFLKDEREHLKALMDARDEMGGKAPIEDKVIDLDDEPDEIEQVDEDSEMALDDGETFEVTNVDWDTDGVSPRRLGLPVGGKPIMVEVPYEVIDGGYDAVEEYISDYLSDTYEFCHNGFDCPQLDELMRI